MALMFVILFLVIATLWGYRTAEQHLAPLRPPAATPAPEHP